MTDPHLTEEALQLFAHDPGSAGAEARTHLAACPDCRNTAEAYRLLMTSLQEQPVLSFEFDLVAAVITKLEAPMKVAETPSLTSRFLTLLVCVVIAAIVAIPAWLFRKTVDFVFSEISAGFIWIIGGAAGIAVLFKLYKYYREYQQVLHLLNE